MFFLLHCFLNVFHNIIIKYDLYVQFNPLFPRTKDKQKIKKDYSSYSCNSPSPSDLCSIWSQPKTQRIGFINSTADVCRKNGKILLINRYFPFTKSYRLSQFTYNFLFVYWRHPIKT